MCVHVYVWRERGQKKKKMKDFVTFIFNMNQVNHKILKHSRINVDN